MSPEPPGAWPPGFARTRADRQALVALAYLPTMLPREIHALAWREGSAAACLAAILGGRAGTDGDREAVAAADPPAVLSAMERTGARFAAPGDDEYPPALLDLTDPPACLFIRGARAVPWPVAVAVVGARKASPYGREVARAIASLVATTGLVVVSGAALGIDAAAHHGALAVSGPTAAVLGCGIDVLYPYSNRGLIEDIARRGTLVSEYPPRFPPRPRRFPARNRIVAALARAVVVVEGAAGSGSLLTAEFGMELGREVMAVPGPVTDPLSSVPHALIRDGATLVRGPQDVLAQLGLAAEDPDAEALLPSGLSTEEARVLERLTGTAQTLDSLVGASGLSFGSTLAALSSLEIRGLVRSAGGRYERTLVTGRI